MVASAAALLLVSGLAACQEEDTSPRNTTYEMQLPVSIIVEKLGELSVKGRAPTTGYSREQFGSGWSSTDSCDMRNRILRRDLTEIVYDEDSCTILSGMLQDPYTGKEIAFTRGMETSGDVQIDHIVALSNAWQTGAQSLSIADRVYFANDPLNLAAVEGRVNQQKGDGDAATWLPPSKAYRCDYVARQVLVKEEYDLWVTAPERDAIENILESCATDVVSVPR